MNILFLSGEDCANVGYRYAQAVNDTLPDEHKARAICFVDNYLEYPKDISCPPDEQFSSSIEWADIVHVFDAWPTLRERIADKPRVVVTYNGTCYRNDPQKFNSKDREEGITQRLCTTLDMTKYDLEWMPVPMEDMRDKNTARRDEFVVSHAPTNLVKKGTRYVIAAAQAMEEEPVEFDIIRNVSNAECLKRKARSHLHIDQIGDKALGYGVNALEAWALGLPVISGASDELILLMEKRLGLLPFIRCGPDSLVEHVRWFIDSSKYRREWAKMGIDYLEKHHSPAIVARKLLEVYERM